MSSEEISERAAIGGAWRSHSFDTDAVAPRERHAFWKEAIFEAIANVDITCRDEEDFRGSIQWRGVNLDGGTSMSVARATAMPQVARRGARQLARQREPFLGLTLQKKGVAVIEQAGHTSILKPGDINLLDVTQPYRMSFEEPFEHLVVMIPYERLVPLLPSGGQWRGRVLSGASPLGSVLNAHMDAVATALDRLGAPSRNALLERTIDLVALAFTDELNTFAGSASTVRRALVLRAVQFVDGHLADPTLSAGAVASALGVSVGYLQHAFQATDTTLGEYIRQRRLERCREDIGNVLRAGEQIREIAMRWGFGDMPHFSRMFRRAFGHSPREHRAMTLARGVRGR